MVVKPAVRQILRWIRSTFDEIAARRGWGPEDYRVLVKINEPWGAVHIVLVTDAVPHEDAAGSWPRLHDEVQTRKDRDARELFLSLSFTLRSFDQIRRGGIYSVSDEFEDIRDLT